jgi:hypothetical protein
MLGECYPTSDGLAETSGDGSRPAPRTIVAPRGTEVGRHSMLCIIIYMVPVESKQIGGTRPVLVS